MALFDVLERLAGDESSELVVSHALERLGEVLGFERAYLARAMWPREAPATQRRGEPFLECVSEWFAPGFELASAMQTAPYWLGMFADMGFPDGLWARLVDGEHVVFTPDLFDASHRHVAEERGVLRFEFMPLIQRHALWGVAMLSFCRRHAPLTDEERRALRTVLGVCTMRMAPTTGQSSQPTPVSVSTRARLTLADDAAGTILDASAGAARWWGVSVAQLLHRSGAALLQWPASWESIRESVRGGERVQCTVMMERELGGPLQIGATLTHTEREGAGAVDVRLNSLATMRHSLELVSTTERQLHRILRDLRVWTWECDPGDQEREGVLAWTEPLRAPHRVLRRTMPMHEGFLRFAPWLSLAERARLAVRISASLHDAESEGLDMELRLAPSVTLIRWARLHLRVERNLMGRPDHLSGVLSDASQQRALEERVVAMQHAENLSFLSQAMVHDLNNLLTAMTTSADMLAVTTPQDEGWAEDIEVLSSANERAGALIQNYLEFARSVSSRSGELVELNQLVRGHERIFQRVLGRRIALRLHLSAEPCPVTLSATDAERIVLNLLVNARDALEGHHVGAPRVTLRTQLVTSPQGPRVRLSVEDNGPGMSAETIKALFTPFFTTKNTGHGIGLSSCRKILEVYQGTILGDNAQEGGALFTVELPLGSTSEAEVDEESATCWLLIDEPFTAFWTTHALESCGASVRVVTEDQLSQERPDALTLLVLPGWLDGAWQRATVRDALDTHGWPHPIIVLTSDSLQCVHPTTDLSDRALQVLTDLRARWRALLLGE